MENDPNKSLSGKPREFGNFAKTQGILFAQVVNYLILKVKVLAAKISYFLLESRYVRQVSFVYVMVTNHVNSLARRIFAVRQGKRREFENAI